MAWKNLKKILPVSNKLVEHFVKIYFQLQDASFQIKFQNIKCKNDGKSLSN